MYQDKRIGALLLMAGTGLRFGSQTPKQFHLLGGKPVYSYALNTLLNTGLFDEILLVCHPNWMDRVEKIGPLVRVVEGGATRQESSYKGLRGFMGKIDAVLIHDAVRPFVSEEIVRENVETALGCGAADTCIPSADTLVHTSDGQKIDTIPRREEFLRGQTPQTFRMDWILEAHEKALQAGVVNGSCDCRLVVQAGRPVWVVKGEERNLKITSELDLFLAEQLLNSCQVSSQSV